MESEVATAPNPIGDCNPAISSSSSSICEECGLIQWKYRCPGCSIRTCSLPCVTAHKKRTGCTGKRDRTAFVRLSRFDDNLLLSDYNMLEEAKRISESAFRMQRDFPVDDGYNNPKKLKLLLNATCRRKIKLLTFPSGMSNRMSNQSMYDLRSETIFWTIEWRFHGTDVVLTDYRVDEHLNLSVVFGKHLTPGPWNHPLRLFWSEDLNDLKLFLKKNAVGMKSPYRLLNMEAPVGMQFKDAVIMEHPVIYVFLPSQSYDFEVESWSDSDCEQARYTVCNTPSPKGNSFREEDIEEGDTQHDTPGLVHTNVVSDSRCSPVSPFSVTNATHDFSKMETPNKIAKITSSSSPHDNEAHRVAETINLTDNVSGVSFGMYDFEQELRDVYGNFGEIDPDEFLCLDGGYGEQNIYLEGDYFIQDELEEGEIPY